MIKFVVEKFAWIILGACAVSFIHPPLFTWFSGNLITISLGIIMFSMGIQLSLDDFRKVAGKPHYVLAGVGLQFLIMPFLGYLIAGLFQLPADLAVGLILVACCPGGTASNVITYLARADVALSVTMTAISTMLAVVLTPLLTSLYAGSRVDIPEAGLFWSTVQVVLLPVAAGLALHPFTGKLAGFSENFFPAVAVVLITLIVASIVGSGKKEILDNGFVLPLAVFSLHIAGFALGYLGSFVLLRSPQASRTISIEVGMQNSGLGVVLARQNFSSPLTAIPSAISSLAHSLIGSVLAAWWRRHDWRRPDTKKK